MITRNKHIFDAKQIIEDEYNYPVEVLCNSQLFITIYAHSGSGLSASQSRNPGF